MFLKEVGGRGGRGGGREGRVRTIRTKGWAVCGEATGT